MGKGKKELLDVLDKSRETIELMGDDAEFMAVIVQFNNPSDGFIVHIHAMDEE